jgi:zinc transport system substrate-binding protein
MRYIISLLLTSTAALAEVPRVVTDIPPVHSIAAAVMEGLGEPELLLEKGASEHFYQLKPSQAASIADAGLVIWIGPELTPWLEAILANRPEGALNLGLLQAEGTFTQAYGETGGHADHATGEAEHDDHGHEEAETHDEAGHEEPAHGDEGHDEAGHTADAHDGLDPHAWLDPANGKLWATLIAGQLSQIDPENAATYAANAERVMAAIDAADARAAELLATAKGKSFVAFHDAYGYYFAHYGLTMAGTIALGDASAPGAARLVGLQEMVAEGSVACLFPEVQHDPDLLTQLAEGTGVPVGAALDPVGAQMDHGPGLYPALLTGLAQSISDCGL